MNPAKRPKKSDLTREKILRAAAELIANQGIEKTTTRKIAEQAGIANGLVSHYFPKMDELFWAVIQLLAQDAYREIENPPENASGLEKIRHMTRANLEFFLNDPVRIRCFVLFYYYATLEKRMKDLNTLLFSRAAERFQSYLADHFRGRGDMTTEPVLRAWAEVLHNHLFGSIMKYGTMTQVESKDLYIARVMREFDLFVLR